MIESIRSCLYPLGFLANLFFGARFFIQWIESERKKESVVSPWFWRLSLLAHLSLTVHCLIQIQFPICLVQSLNGCIAWRNLNLMGEKKYSFRKMVGIMIATVLFIILLFFLQASTTWMRAPTLPWTGTQASQVGLSWHIAGFLGIFLFASRYWIQWWLAEKHQKSFLGKSFWWISCIGAFFSLIYSFRLVDPVNILGFGLGFIPYIRNLMLVSKKQSLQKKTKDSLFLFAGEQSGDVLGGNLIQALKKSSPSLDLYGVGGKEMENAGMRIHYPMERFQVMGFSAVLKALPRLAVNFNNIKKEILDQQPAGVILIDYPDFNMRLAKSLRKGGYGGKIVHYVCPSVWAWRKKRIKNLARTLDHLLSILPFEGQCFTQTKLSVSYIGHPLIAAIDSHSYESVAFPQPLIALFPGSRKQEILLNLPLQLAAAKKLSSFQIAVSVARPSLEPVIRSLVDKDTLLVPAEKRYELMRAAHGAFATSGTIILELGLHSIPTVATYRLGLFNYLLGRYILRLRLPYYTLVNIICNEEVYPEYIHKDLSVDAIAQSLKQMLDNPVPCKKECARLRSLLQQKDASQMAAHIILEEINALPVS